MRALLCGLLLSWSCLAVADDLAPYLDDQTFLVASLDMAVATDEATIAPLLTVVETLGAAATPQGATPVGVMLREAVGVLRELHQKGATSVALVAGVDDVRPDFGPLLLVRVEDAANLNAAAAVLAERLASLNATLRATAGRRGLLIGSQPTLDRYSALQAKPRPDLTRPLTGERPFELIVSPGADSRRVIRELWPDLPSELASLDGRLIADDLLHTALTLFTKPAGGAELRLQAANEPAAEQLERAIEELYAAGVNATREHRPEFASIVEQATEVLKPRREGDAVTLAIRSGDPASGRLVMRVLAPAIAEASGRNHRAKKMNDMKQISLAILNYESANGCFPGPIVDAEGKPLLSWRVAILPYLEQQALFNEFRLDEPWDSPHNLKKAEFLPGPYFANAGDPQQKRTTYLRPVYPGSDLAKESGETAPVEKKSFGRKYFVRPGDQLRQFTDGTSRTILIAEVAPEHAEFWTKPADWEVDLADTMAMLRTDRRKGFVTAWADGHAKYLPFTIEPSLLKKMITKAGGEAYSSDDVP